MGDPQCEGKHTGLKKENLSFIQHTFTEGQVGSIGRSQEGNKSCLCGARIE